MQDEPFVFKRESSNSSESPSCVGNDCYYGYSIELLEKLAMELNFKYEIYEVPDGKYGSLDPDTNKWNGMVAELLPDEQGLTVIQL